MGRFLILSALTHPTCVVCIQIPPPLTTHPPVTPNHPPTDPPRQCSKDAACVRVCVCGGGGVRVFVCVCVSA